ncbi:MAG: hypothetical protein KDN19_04380 [Verrucomicrobiae bacterium]|nr:hypothetical protein [Verrucomicrobiae bacterium]
MKQEERLSKIHRCCHGEDRQARESVPMPEDEVQAPFSSMNFSGRIAHVSD